MCFRTKIKTQQQQNKNLNKTPMTEPEIESSCTQSGCVTSAPARVLRLWSSYLTVSTQWVET